MECKNVSVTWAGDVTSISGKAQYARALLELLIKGGAHVRIEPVQTNKPNADLQPFWHEVLNRNTKITPGLVKITHGVPHVASPNATGGPHICLTHWDTINYPIQWIEHTNRNFKQVWTSNRSAVERLQKAGLVTVESHTIPFPIELDTHTNKAEINGIGPNTLVFGTTDIWDQRANISDLIVAYIAEFSSSDNVALVIKTNPPDMLDGNQRNHVLANIKAIKDMVNKPNKPNIIVLQDIFTQVAMDNILRRFDVFCVSNRGSGLSVSGSKALGMGKVIIAPYVGVFQDFFGAYSKYDKLLKRIETQPDVVYGHPDSNPLDRWTRPDVDSIVKQMKIAYVEHLGNYAQKTKQIDAHRGDLLSGPFSPQACLDNMLHALEKVTPATKVVFA